MVIQEWTDFKECPVLTADLDLRATLDLMACQERMVSPVQMDRMLTTESEPQVLQDQWDPLALPELLVKMALMVILELTDSKVSQAEMAMLENLELLANLAQSV